MSPITVSLKIFDDQFTPLIAAIRYSARDTNREFDKRRKVVDAKALTYIRYTPARPHYPIVWQTERQRRAFFATNGFGRGIPTTRSGKLPQSWEIPLTETATGGSISLDNGQPYAIYVQGDIMQKMHIASGYHSVNDAVDIYAPQYGDVLEQSFFSIGG